MWRFQCFLVGACVTDEVGCGVGGPGPTNPITQLAPAKSQPQTVTRCYIATSRAEVELDFWELKCERSRQRFQQCNLQYPPTPRITLFVPPSVTKKTPAQVTGGLRVSRGRQSNLCFFATAPTGVLTAGTAGQHR